MTMELTSDEIDLLLQGTDQVEANAAQGVQHNRRLIAVWTT